MGLDKILTTLPQHSHQIIVASVAYSALFWILSPLVSAKVASVYRRSPKRTQTNWSVRVVSLIQATFICGCAIHVMFWDVSRTQMDARGRLTAYSPMAGRVQAFAAGYFLWDLLISVLYVRILGMSSLIHAFCALAITMLGFVSIEIPPKGPSC